MEGAKREPAVELDVERRHERADLLEVTRLELRRASTSRRSSCASVIASGESVRHLEQEVVGVAEDHRPAERGEPVEHLARLVAALHGVAEADDLLDPEALELGDDRSERRVVAVDVRDERERHGSTIGRR